MTKANRLTHALYASALRQVIVCVCVCVCGCVECHVAKKNFVHSKLSYSGKQTAIKNTEKDWINFPDSWLRCKLDMTASARHVLPLLPLPNSIPSCQLLKKPRPLVSEQHCNICQMATSTCPGIITPCFGFPTTAGKMHRGASSPAMPA